MKKLIVLMLLLSCVLCFSASSTLALENEIKGEISLSGAWAIYPTAVAWAEGFQKIFPKVKINISAGGAGKGASDVIAGLVDIGMVSRDPDKVEIAQGVNPIYVLHDAVYFVVSDKNPAVGDLLIKGLNNKALADIYILGKIDNWGKALNSDIDKSIHLYTRADSCGAAGTVAKYLGVKQEDLKGIGVYGDPGLLEQARKDPVGIGYSNFSYVFTRDGSIVEGVKLVPIDSNKNGIADPEEIYANREQAITAIRSRRYPITRKNYFFTKGRASGLVKEFILFALSEEGTRIVEEVGTSLPLTKAERQRVLKTI